MMGAVWVFLAITAALVVSNVIEKLIEAYILSKVLEHIGRKHGLKLETVSVIKKPDLRLVPKDPGV